MLDRGQPKCPIGYDVLSQNQSEQEKHWATIHQPRDFLLLQQPAHPNSTQRQLNKYLYFCFFMFTGIVAQASALLVSSMFRCWARWIEDRDKPVICSAWGKDIPLQSLEATRKQRWEEESEDRRSWMFVVSWSNISVDSSAFLGHKAWRRLGTSSAPPTIFSSATRAFFSTRRGLLLVL